jgi:hypothetical protein
MSDGLRVAEVLLGLSGFRVMSAEETGSEMLLSTESTELRAFCDVWGAC